MFGKNTAKFIKGVMILEAIKPNVTVDKTIFLRFLDPSFLDTRLVYPDIYYRWDKKSGLACNGDVSAVLAALLNFKLVSGRLLEVAGEYRVRSLKIRLNATTLKQASCTNSENKIVCSDSFVN